MEHWAWFWSCRGRHAEGLAALERSLRLDPHDPLRSLRLRAMTMALYFSREYLAAVKVATQAIRSYPNDPLHYRWLAAALGQLDRSDEAREALVKATADSPAAFDLLFAGAYRGIGRKITPTCSKACARPAGRKPELDSSRRSSPPISRDTRG